MGRAREGKGRDSWIRKGTEREREKFMDKEGNRRGKGEIH